MGHMSTNLEFVLIGRFNYKKEIWLVLVLVRQLARIAMCSDFVGKFVR